MLVGGKESISFRPESDTALFQMVSDPCKQAIQHLDSFHLLYVTEWSAFDFIVCQGEVRGSFAVGSSRRPVMPRREDKRRRAAQNDA